MSWHQISYYLSFNGFWPLSQSQVLVYRIGIYLNYRIGTQTIVWSISQISCNRSTNNWRFLKNKACYRKITQSKTTSDQTPISGVVGYNSPPIATPVSAIYRPSPPPWSPSAAWLQPHCVNSHNHRHQHQFGRFHKFLRWVCCWRLSAPLLA